MVDVRGDRWRVAETIAHQGCVTCRLVGASATNPGVARTLLLPFDRLRAVERPTRLHAVGRRRWIEALRGLLTSACSVDGLRGLAGASIDLHGYQLEPALACARGATRLLLADEVGLGKTIEAALILADLRARNEAARALILCPAGLCAQWQHELEDRFCLAPELVDRAVLRRRLQCSAAGATPWEQLPIAVASIDFVKQPEVLHGMKRARWDLLVVDEAHLCALAPERAAAVNWLASRAVRVVLATATPHPGDAGAFQALCRIGASPGEGPPVMFRRTRAGLGLSIARRCRVMGVALSPPERRLHALLERYTSRVWRAAPGAGSAADARLAMIVLRKRAASGVASLVASLTRRLRWLSCPDEAAGEQLLLPYEGDEGPEEDEEPGSVLAAPGLADPRAERRILERLVGLARDAADCDSKLRVLVRVIRRVGEPAIVFTEYRDTLSRLAELLGSDHHVAMIHGGMDRAARSRAVASFVGGRAGLLLATDAAAHGLNLQSRCRLVINLELPWNPVRLEQRIGRVDRIGQRRTVHALHLVARETAEADVLAHLAIRIERSRRALGPTPGPLGPASEVEVARLVFERSRRHPLDDDHRQDATATTSPEGNPDGTGLVVRQDLAGPARAEADRLRSIRSLASSQRGKPEWVAAELARTGPWCTTLPAREWDEVVLAVFEADVVDGQGQLVESRPIALVWTPAAARSGPDRSPPACLEPESPLLTALSTEAARLASKRLAELRLVVAPRLEPVSRRVQAAACASDRVPVVACQPGLFDRRALRHADEERESRAQRQEDAAERIAASSRAAVLSLAGPPRLALAAVVSRRG